jgi:putative endopeptidase
MICALGVSKSEVSDPGFGKTVTVTPPDPWNPAGRLGDQFLSGSRWLLPRRRDRGTQRQGSGRRVPFAARAVVIGALAAAAPRLERMTFPSGIPIDELDPGIRPQDDLFRHVNGRWLARTEIPADRARDSAFRILAEEAANAVREIVEEAASAPEGSEERKFGDLYASFMDADRAELLGSQPISQTLAAARAVSSIPELLETLGRLERLGIRGLYRLFADTDPGRPERYLVFFEQAAISLPDESYYREERFTGIRDAFAGHVQRMFELAGLPDADRAASRVLALETAVAGHHWDSVANRDREKTYNPFTWTGVLPEGPDLRGWLAAMDPPDGACDEIVLRQPSFSTGLASLLTDELVPAWRDWLCWQVIHSAAGYLSEAFVQEDFDFYCRTLSGTPQLRERWKRGVALVERAMGEAVGRVYVGRHFPPGARERMDVLVANLLEAYRQSIEKLEWMGEDTRRRALDKLPTTGRSARSSVTRSATASTTKVPSTTVTAGSPTGGAHGTGKRSKPGPAR